MELTCPECDNADQSSIVGIEYRGVWDGILEWQCLICDHQWSRFGPDDYRTKRLEKVRSNG